MFLSQLILNIRSRDVARDQNNPYEMHRTILRAFPVFDHDAERVLFRLDGENINVLLVQSTMKPDWDPLVQMENYLAKHPSVKTYEELLFVKGQLLRFQLRANAVKRDKSTGKRVALVKDDDRVQWLERKGKDHGFSLVESMASSHNSNWRQFTMPVQGQRKRATVNMVDFQGVLRVENPELLNLAIRNGVGPAKGLGCGLFAVARY